jgi:hypothetical protein
MTIGPIVNMVRNASYEIFGNQSGKVKRNGYIYNNILEDISGKRHAYQKWFSLDK